MEKKNYHKKETVRFSRGGEGGGGRGMITHFGEMATSSMESAPSVAFPLRHTDDGSFYSRAPKLLLLHAHR